MPFQTFVHAIFVILEDYVHFLQHAAETDRDLYREPAETFVEKTKSTWSLLLESDVYAPEFNFLSWHPSPSEFCDVVAEVALHQSALYTLYG